MKVCYELPRKPLTPKGSFDGSKYWFALHDIADRIPCETCKPVAKSFMVFFHDLVNKKLDKPIHSKENFIFWQNQIKNIKLNGNPMPRQSLPFGLTEREKANPHLLRKLSRCIRKVEAKCRKEGLPKGARRVGIKTCGGHAVAVCRTSIRR